MNEYRQLENMPDIFKLDMLSALADRTNKRLFALIIVLIIVLVGSNLYWILKFLGR